MVRAKARTLSSCIALIAATMVVVTTTTVDGRIGVNWGTMMSHPILPSTVVRMLKDNGINTVKLFDADSWTVRALAGSGIEVMLAIPNDQLGHISSKYKHAEEWVEKNVTKYDHDNVDIKYVAVGNEPFLKSYNGSFMDTTFPALRNIQNALNDAGVGDRIKATIPLNADVYSSPASNPVPSAGNFRQDIRNLMVQIVRYLHSNNAPFVVNIYPYLSLYQNPNFPVDYAFFDGTSQPVNDGGTKYYNVFDANYDTLVSSLKKAGVSNMKVVVGEVGWPTDGDKRATAANAKRFYDGLFKRMAKNTGTPLRPGRLDVYLFGLFDEDMKSVLPGNFERHWGLFGYDGKPKFEMDFGGKGNDRYLVGAKRIEYLPSQWCVLDGDAEEKPDAKAVANSVNYACSNADCTPLGYGSSCSGLSQKGNVSYAFNVYFQTMDQDVRACDFNGLGKITKSNASQNGCLFPVQIISTGDQRVTVSLAAVVTVVAAAMTVLVSV